MENSYVTSISFFYGLNEDELIDWRLMFPGSTSTHSTDIGRHPS